MTPCPIANCVNNLGLDNMVYARLKNRRHGILPDVSLKSKEDVSDQVDFEFRKFGELDNVLKVRVFDLQGCQRR